MQPSEHSETRYGEKKIPKITQFYEIEIIGAKPIDGGMSR